MRIAICFSGQIRTGIQASPNIKRFLGEHLGSCDFFVHTWNFNKQKDAKTHWPLEFLDHDTIQRFKEIWNPKTMVVEDYAETVNRMKRERGISTFSENQPVWYSNGVSLAWTPMYYSWYMSVLYKRDHEIINGFKYDLVLKMRPDIIYPRQRSLSREIDAWSKDKSLFYTDTMTLGNRIDDVFWYSSSEIMDRASCFWLEKLKHPGYEWNHFSWMCQLGINLGHTGEGYTPMRYQCINMDPLTEWGKIYVEDIKEYAENLQKVDNRPASFEEWYDHYKDWLDKA